MSDRRVVFRIFAPQAQRVRVTSGDLTVLWPSEAGQMKKLDNGVWEFVLDPVDPGAYRYSFNMDGVTVIDPRNPRISESNNNVSSLVYVPGSEISDTKDVPHGAVASVTYYSTALGRFRRMHVYTPPGYELGGGKFPVFYLLHGAGDCDEAWTSVGRAGFILDNLIAARQAKPMIVVMPAGHTTYAGYSAVRGPRDEFYDDFTQDIMPYVEKQYRVLTGRKNRAMAGLSMGGIQTMDVAFRNLAKFAYIGVFSAYAESVRRPAAASDTAPAATARPGWEPTHLTDLDNPALKKGTKLIWIGTGVNDPLMPSTRATVELLEKHGFAPVFKESPGAHTWVNWRNYLNEFAPQLFH
jgi:enterochelin esterase family protein